MLRLPLFSVVVLRWIKPQLVPVLLALAFAFGLSVVSDARADAPVTWWWWRDIDGGKSYNTTADYRATKDQVCAEYVPRSMTDRGITTWQITATSVGTTGCNYNYKNTTNGQTGTISNSGAFFNVSWCANNSAPNTSKPLADQCGPVTPAPNCGPDKGKVVNTDHYTVVSPSKLAAGLDVCIPVPDTTGGCSFTAAARVGGYNKTTSKWEYQFMGPLTHSGNVCTGNGMGATDPVKEDTPTKCGAGMCVGTVNGVELCVKCAQTDSSNPTTNTKTNADGSTTQTSTVTNVSVTDNSVTTTTTTTTSTTPAGGGTPTTKTETESKTESKDSYCQRNPSDSQCKATNSVGGGDTCDAPPVCNGDAVQCAMLQQQYKTRCELQKSDEVADFGHALASGQDPDANKLPTPGSAPVVNLKDTYNGLDQMGVVAACMPDVRINIPGMVWLAPTTLNISTEPLCQHGKLLGYLNILATCLVCAYMLKGSF